MKDAVTSLDDLPLVMSVEQVGKVLGIGRTLTYELIKDGIIRSIEAGHRRLITKQALAEYLQLQLQLPAENVVPLHKAG